MKKMMAIALTLLLGVILTGCTANANFECGTGTVLKGGVCVPGTEEDNTNNPVVASLCDSGPGAYEVVNGEFSNPPAEPWFFIGGWMVSQPDSIWMEEFDAIIFDVTDAALADRNVWDGAFWQPKVYTEQGCTYTITYTLRTDEAQGRDVIVFLENTDDNYNKFIEDTVTLTQEYQTFTYTYVATFTNDDTKIGIFFANDVGTVIIDSILVERSLTE